jgi:hypothetical protein
MARMHLLNSILTHLRDFNIIIRGNSVDGYKKSRNIDGRQVIIEDKACGGDGDDFFEDACYGERYNRSTLKKCELGCCHEKSDDAWEEDGGSADDGAFVYYEGIESFGECGEAFDGMARRKRVKNMMGATKIDEKGLEVAGLRRGGFV